MKRIKSSTAILIITLSSLLLAGCFNVDHKFSEIRNGILSKMDNQFRVDTEFGLGAVGLAAARVAVSFSHDEDAKTAKDILADVSKVQIGVYKNASRNGNLNIEYLNKLNANMNEDGWECIVKNCQHGEASAVYIKESGDEINEIFIISIERDEVNLVNVEGNLTRAALTAIREKGLDINI